VGKMYNMP